MIELYILTAKSGSANRKPQACIPSAMCQTARHFPQKMITGVFLLALVVQWQKTSPQLWHSVFEMELKTI